MSGFNEAIHRIKREHKSLISFIAKLGYASRGTVYLIIGYFAALALVGQGQTKGSKGALTSVVNQPFGNMLLWIVGVGLICYSIWRLIQSLLDTDDHGYELKGLAVRAGLFISALTHTSLGLWAMSIASGSQGGSSSSGGGGSSWSAELSSMTGGQYLILLIALCVLGAGCAHIVKGAKSDFLKNLKSLPNRHLETVCQFGLITKGLAFIIISYLFALTALRSKSQKKFGVEDALSFTSDLSYGWLILSLMGLGLIAFGVYSMIEARYRKITL